MGQFKNLMIELQDIVIGECFCDWGIFCENVKSNGGTKDFESKLFKCKSHDDIVNLVNQYI